MAQSEQEQKQLSYDYYWRKQREKFVTEGPKLAKKANELHRKREATWRRSLQYARECGDVLCEARKYFKARSPKWKRWLSRNFDASYETAVVYMRISRKWDDPRIRDAKHGGMTVNSIAGFLRLLNYQKNAEDKKMEIGKKGQDLSEGMTEREKIMSMMRQELRRECFGRELRDLTQQELEILLKGWDFFWPTWYRDLRKTVCQVLEHSPYPSGQTDANGEPFNDSEEETDARMRKTVRNRKQKRTNRNK